MDSIDLYQLTRVCDKELFRTFEHNLSSRKEILRMNDHEIDSIISLVTTLIKHGIGIEGLQKYYLSYNIPQIGKEFDLLRINDDSILNIELKSEDVGIEQIQKQLVQNMHYLSHLSREMGLFTFIASTHKIYRLTKDSTFNETSVSELIEFIIGQKNCFTGDINSKFKVTDFLVSPLNTPEKFISKQYLLTPQQVNNKKGILDVINSGNGVNKFFGITGSAGTGKTLALYDLAHDLASASAKCCIIHCGMLSDEHLYLNENMPNMKIYPASDFYSIDFTQYKYIFVDESHRFFLEQYNQLVEIVCDNNLVCVFAYDKAQTLSHKETERDMVSKILSLSNFHGFKLSDKIRTNKEVSSFIRKLFNINHRDNQIEYPSISITYANDEYEVKLFSNEYMEQGYVYINYTPSRYKRSALDQYILNLNTHQVIGQEFNNVLMLMDRSFKYDEKRKLVASEHKNPDYLYTKLLFQGLTRVREKLALIVVDNPDLFRNILNILNNKKTPNN